VVNDDTLDAIEQLVCDLDRNSRFLTDVFVDQKEGLEQKVKERIFEIEKAQHNALSIAEDLEEKSRFANELAEKAKTADQTKSEFLANMSRGIRTSVNAIIGLSQLVFESELNTQQRDYISKMHSSAEKLLGIINDILDFSKIEAGKLILEKVEFNIENVLTHVADLVAQQAEIKSVELIYQIDPAIQKCLLGDPLRLG